METKQLIDTLMLAVDRALANVHTVTIAKVTTVNATTINCSPVISRVVDGEAINLPEFIEVPPIFMQGGSSYTAHPIAVGDYCLLVFTERCFDRWYDGQDFRRPLELRMHDYSDGFALVGINPLAAAIAIPSVIQQTGDTNQDGDYTHQGDTDHTGDLIRTGTLTQEGDATITGLLSVIGNITASLGISAVSFSGPGGGDMVSSSNMDAAGFKVSGAAGVTGTFTTADAKTVTVTKGIITSIV